jgi:predicted ATPase
MGSALEWVMVQTNFQSEIRPSTIAALIAKVGKRKYGKYLVRLQLHRLRGFEDQSVTFDFPVTAIVGPNGGGKTTILGAAATAYAAIRPRQFFAKSGKYDASMTNWRVEYELIDREVNRTDTFRRTASFTTLKWSRDKINREVVVFGVSRTVPANERAELQRCANASFDVDQGQIDAIQADVVKAVGRILGKDISNYTHMRVDAKGRVSLLTGMTDSGSQYSEFHFGAGESSIIRMVMKIESLGENCLVLIEEIENGLHPVATVHMVEYLIDLADRKNVQAIFTTHSNDALRPLPSEAIWAAVGGKVYQGKLDIASLRAIAGQIDAQLAIFCEDDFAVRWIKAMLRTRRGIAIDGIEIHGMTGDSLAVKVQGARMHDPSSHFPSVCFIDGDSQQTASPAQRVYRLPGRDPESHVIDLVLGEAAKLGGVLAVRLLQPFSESDRVVQALKQVRLTNHDPHVLFEQFGYALGLVPASTVAEAFVTTWAEHFTAEVDQMLAPIFPLLPAEHHLARQPGGAPANLASSSQSGV